MSATEIVPLVTGCIQRAQTRIADGVQQVLNAELGDDPSVALVINDYRERFPARVESAAEEVGDQPEPSRYGTPRQQAPAPVPRRSSAVRTDLDDNGDDWANRRVMEYN
jgi:hypothetical protein